MHSWDHADSQYVLYGVAVDGKGLPVKAYPHTDFQLCTLVSIVARSWCVKQMNYY